MCRGGDNEWSCGRPMKSEGRGEEDEKGKEARVRVKESANRRNKVSEDGMRRERRAHRADPALPRRVCAFSSERRLSSSDWTSSAGSRFSELPVWRLQLWLFHIQGQVCDMKAVFLCNDSAAVTGHRQLLQSKQTSMKKKNGDGKYPWCQLRLRQQWAWRETEQLWDWLLLK